MPCAEGDETLVPGLPRALVERWAVIIHFLSPVRPYRHAALSQAQPAACTRRVRAARGSDPTPKVAPSTPAGMAEKFSWTREPKLDQGRKIVCWKWSGTVFCTISSSSTNHFIFIAPGHSKPIERWERQLEEDQRGKHLLSRLNNQP